MVPNFKIEQAVFVTVTDGEALAWELCLQVDMLQGSRPHFMSCH